MVSLSYRAIIDHVHLKANIFMYFLSYNICRYYTRKADRVAGVSQEEMTFELSKTVSFIVITNGFFFFSAMPGLGLMLVANACGGLFFIVTVAVATMIDSVCETKADRVLRQQSSILQTSGAGSVILTTPGPLSTSTLAVVKKQPTQMATIVNKTVQHKQQIFEEQRALHDDKRAVVISLDENRVFAAETTAL